MDITVLAVLLVLAGLALKQRYQAPRVRLLAQHLGQFNIEPLMMQLHQGYFRALDEQDAERASQIWALQTSAEQSLLQQFQAFSKSFEGVYMARTQVFKLALVMPYADLFFPKLCFDARLVFAVHAQGIARALASDAQPAPRARIILAELYLMQHSCHWFCRSLPTASARLLARHQTSYEQVLEAITPQTRRDYLALVSRKPSHTSG
jgi:hypothetical protein